MRLSIHATLSAALHGTFSTGVEPDETNVIKDLQWNDHFLRVEYNDPNVYFLPEYESIHFYSDDTTQPSQPMGSFKDYVLLQEFLTPFIKMVRHPLKSNLRREYTQIMHYPTGEEYRVVLGYHADKNANRCVIFLRKYKDGSDYAELSFYSSFELSKDAPQFQAMNTLYQLIQLQVENRVSREA